MIPQKNPRILLLFRHHLYFCMYPSLVYLTAQVVAHPGTDCLAVHTFNGLLCPWL